MDFLEQAYFKEINWIQLFPPSPQKVDKVITYPIKLHTVVPYMMIQSQIKIRQLFIGKVWVYILQ